MQAGLLNLTSATAAGIPGGANGINNIAGTRAPELIAVLQVDQVGVCSRRHLQRITIPLATMVPQS